MSYVPVTEFLPPSPDALPEEGERSSLLWSFTLPPSVDADRIEVNIDRLQRLHRVGGMAASIVYDYQGERTEFTPGISGINSDGTALATRAGVTKKAEQTSTQKLDLFPPGVISSCGQILAIHGINKAEKASMVSDRVREGEVPEKVWANELDKSVRQSLRQAGKEHLIARPRRPLQALYASILLMNAVNAVEGYELSTLVYAGVWASVVGLESMRNKAVFGNTLLDHRRWSMSFYSDYQIDRYVALNAMTRVPRLIRARK
ncbi:MAG TPA: hypothetical protein VG992_00580 [Candidatus Saccharimonadales bacterium]|nr:hypothetical protein [Candidatus Saccharimonadales bacterium]